MKLLFVLCVLVGLVSARNAFKQLMLTKFEELVDYAKAYLKEHDLPYSASAENPYWNFMPQYVTSILPGAATEWESPCFSSNTGTFEKSEDGSALNVKIVSKGAKTHNCRDIYMTITVNSMVPTGSVTVGTGAEPIVTTEYAHKYPLDATESEEWDLANKGVRVLQYVNLTTPEAYSNIIKTFELFIPEATQGVPTAVAEMNIDMMSKYTDFAKIEPRDPSLNKLPKAEDVHSGDSFYIMRLDGLNPLLGWAMGSTTGHVTTALWMEDGELYICESTIADSYWPTDHVQKTPYNTWLEEAEAADFQVVYVPMNAEARAMYNETAAREWFATVEGLDYGFKTMIWSWIDTQEDNFPCIGPDFNVCFSWELAEPLLAFIDRAIPEIGDMVWNPGYGKRIGIPDDGTHRTADLYYEASKQGLKSIEVITIPEQDSWMYNTTRYDEPAIGRSMVCCVFVCSSWKAAGVFGENTDSIQCGELTNWDDYALTIHEDYYEQIIGDYSLKLNDFHIKAPYAHMAETCPSVAPHYERDVDC